MRRLLAGLLVAVALGAHSVGGASAQPSYPTRTVRLILPFNPASATDIAARMFADRLSKLWGKPIVIENRPGGDGLVAINAFISAHDDHTLFFGPAGVFTVPPYEHDTIPYDPQRDFEPIASTSNVVLAVSAPAEGNIKTLDEMIGRIRAAPGKIDAAASNGVSDFLLFGFLKSLNLDVAKVPYRDIMQAPNDLAQNRIQILATSLAVVQPLTSAGRIKVLVVTGRRRIATNPDVPTAAEAGYPALTMESAGGIFGPRGMPLELRQRIAADIVKAAGSDKEIEQKLVTTGQIMSVHGPAELGASVKEQRDKLAELAKILGVKAAHQ